MLPRLRESDAVRFKSSRRVEGVGPLKFRRVRGYEGGREGREEEREQDL
jgi:hypothetical protein